jgi:oligosaccharide translocation protein RFT1
VSIHTTSQTLLNGLLVGISLFGLIFAVFGPFYARAAVRLLFSSSWQGRETEDTLMMFCPYVLILGLNGISEAFLHAVAPPKTFLAQVLLV